MDQRRSVSMDGSMTGGCGGRAPLEYAALSR